MTARERLANALLHEHLTTASLGTLMTMLGEVSDELFEDEKRAETERKYQTAVNNYARAMAPTFGIMYPAEELHKGWMAMHGFEPYTDRQMAAAGDV